MTYPLSSLNLPPFQALCFDPLFELAHLAHLVDLVFIGLPQAHTFVRQRQAEHVLLYGDDGVGVNSFAHLLHTFMVI